MKPTIYLFDIDGTLVTTGGAGRKALQRVFRDAFNTEDVFAGFAFAGMTDPAIIREGLIRVGHVYDEGRAEALLARYIDVLHEELKAASALHRLHAGMQDVLTVIRTMQNVALGLGTGNIEKGAQAKLAPLGVYDHFAFGGFGSDHEDRAELIRIGIARGATRLGRPAAECRAVIIGDTPKDVAAAKANGAQTLAVATGQFTLAQLQQTGAEYVCADVTDAGARAFLLSAN